MDWTDTRINMLLDGYKHGLPYAEIANNLGCSRNAVCGKVNRLGLGDKPLFNERMNNGGKENHRNAVLGWAARKRNGTVARRPRTISKFVFKPPPIEMPFVGVPLKELPLHSCHYPQGDGPFVFCGQPIETGPYCGFHHNVCHRGF